VYADARNTIIIFLGVPSKCGVAADDVKYFLCDLESRWQFISLLFTIYLKEYYYKSMDGSCHIHPATKAPSIPDITDIIANKDTNKKS
jgi:hypothetical protein